MKNVNPFNANSSKFPLIPLESVGVASPCSASWDAMTGDDQARFCKACAKNVYNLSEMTKAEAEALIQAKEGHLCIRYYQRTDGTILTQDCPVGLMAASPQLNGKFKIWGETANLFMLCGALIAGLITLPTLLSAAESHRKASAAVTMGEMPATAGLIAIPVATPKPTPVPTAAPKTTKPPVRQGDMVIMGKIACPPPKPTPTPVKESAKKATKKGPSRHQS